MNKTLNSILAACPTTTNTQAPSADEFKKVGDGTDHGLHDALTTWFGLGAENRT